jgi:hypothetical protein
MTIKHSVLSHLLKGNVQDRFSSYPEHDISLIEYILIDDFHGYIKTIKNTILPPNEMYPFLHAVSS